MKAVFLGAAFLLLAACGSAEETLLRGCQLHNAAITAMAPLMAQSMLSQAQVDAIFESERAGNSICDGTARDFVGALDKIEAEALRLSFMQRTTE